MTDLTEKKISSEKIFDGKVLHVAVDRVLLPNGEEGIREIVLHRGAVAVIPITDDEEVICVRQFRYVHGQVLLEIPAGKLEESDSDVREAALRELEEETGASCESLEEMGVLYPTPAICSEKIHLFMARGLKFGETHPDEDEFLEIERIPLRTMVHMVMGGEVPDSKTQACVLRAWLTLHPGELANRK